MITDSGINTSGGARKGIAKDKKQKDLIAERQAKRKLLEDLDIFIKAVMNG